MSNKFQYLKLYLNKYQTNEQSDVIKMLATIGLNYLLLETQSASLTNLKSYFGNFTFFYFSSFIHSFILLFSYIFNIILL